jgi:hypothetical protein
MQGTISIRLVTPSPEWAKPAITALRQISAITILADDSRLMPDVILHYGDNADLACQQHGFGRLGFWFFRWAGSSLVPLAAARQSAAMELPLEVGLWVRYPNGECLCLYQSFGFLEAFMPKRGVKAALAKAAFFPNRVLSTYCQTGVLPYCKPETLAIGLSCYKTALAEYKAIARKAINKLFFKEQWAVMAGEGGSAIPANPQWQLEPNSNCFWADPFPFIHQGRRWILVEELPYATWRGHLAAIELLEDGCYGEPQSVMVADHHLSYPFLLEWQGNLYLLPESGAARNVVLWQCEQFPSQWRPAATLLDHVYAADATLMEYQGRWWMFVAVAQEGACIHDELHIYFADTPLGPWQPHAQNPVKSDARNSRPAGNLYIEKGILYRPAQDCGTEYGSAVVLNRVDVLDTSHFAETPVARLDRDWRKGFLRYHTLSRWQGLWAMDGLRLVPRWHGK